MTDVRSYHGQPVLKEPVWTWEIPCYFFTGGLAGASAGLAWIAELRGEQVLAKRTWAAALAGVAVSPVLLISDLGRPMKFFNMLRMFKVTSPMSVGTWILTVSGPTTAAACARAWLGVFPRAGRLAAPTAAVFGLPLSTYTAALAANTAVPTWHEARKLLPWVFASGAALSAGSAAAIATPIRHAGTARRLALGGAIAELASKELMERKLGPHGEPYKHGAARTFGHIGRGCLLAGSAMLATRGARSRSVASAAGALLLTGALSARWSVFKAGFGSVADPKYVVAPQRARLDTGQRVRASPTPSSAHTNVL